LSRIASIRSATLGWYRECGIISHTNDLDFIVIADHIVSMEHFDLLMVSQITLRHRL
jgi:hypothetical protein